MTTKRLPNFFIIGAARSATSSLWFYLREHPDIFMSPDKEARFFGYFDDEQRAASCKYADIEAYASLFEKAGDARIIGEATPTYLSLPESAYSIHRYCPDAMLFASLRNPVDRAFSYYEMAMSKGKGRFQSFDAWMADNDFWSQQGGYAEHLERYISLFGRERLMVVLFEDIQRDAASVIADIHRFLDIEVRKPGKQPEAYNRGGKPKGTLGTLVYRMTTHPGINRAIKPLVPRWGIEMVHRMRSRAVSPGQMDPETRRRLTASFRDDILHTESMIGRDLSHWLECE